MSDPFFLSYKVTYVAFIFQSDFFTVQILVPPIDLYIGNKCLGCTDVWSYMFLDKHIHRIWQGLHFCSSYKYSRNKL